MANEIIDITVEQAEILRGKGLTCAKINSMINRNLAQAKQDKKDANMLREFGLANRGLRQEQIAQAQEDSAKDLQNIKRKLCPLK
jgi:cell division septum initiation protein DivIVA